MCAPISVAESGAISGAPDAPSPRGRKEWTARERSAPESPLHDSFECNFPDRPAGPSGIYFFSSGTAPGKIPSRGARSFCSRSGLGKRLARHHLVALRGVIHEDRLDGRNLLQVGRLQAFHHILVRMVGAALVVEHVLNELESGDAHRVKAQVIGAAGVAIGDGGNAEVLQRRNPLRKDRRNGPVSLRVDAANFAGAVIDIEIRRKSVSAPVSPRAVRLAAA